MCRPAVRASSATALRFRRRSQSLAALGLLGMQQNREESFSFSTRARVRVGPSDLTHRAFSQPPDRASPYTLGSSRTVQIFAGIADDNGDRLPSIPGFPMG